MREKTKTGKEIRDKEKKKARRTNEET